LNFGLDLVRQLADELRNKLDLKNIMFSKSKKYNPGFTLVEMLVVVAVIGIMTTVSLVSMQSSKSNARLNAAQGEVIATIRLAQSYALQGKMQASKTPCAYVFKFMTQSRYQIFYKPPTASGCASPGANSPGEYFDLVAGVTVPANVVGKEIIFSVPFGGVSGTALTDIAGTFTLDHAGATSKTIAVSNNGNIVEN